MQIILISGILLLLLCFALLKLLLLRRGVWLGVFFAVVLLLGLALTFIGYLIVPYRIFGENKPVALIVSTPVKAGIYDAVVTIKYLAFPGSILPEKYLLAGDQWIIDGDILKIKFYNKEINLFRFIRLRSRFVKPSTLRHFAELTYNLSKHPDMPGDFLNRHKLPFITVRAASASYDIGDEKTELYLYAGGEKFSHKNK